MRDDFANSTASETAAAPHSVYSVGRVRVMYTAAKNLWLTINRLLKNKEKKISSRAQYMYRILLYIGAHIYENIMGKRH